MLIEKDLADDVAAFLAQKEQLIESNTARWVLFAEGKFQRAFDSDGAAVDYALAQGLVGRFLLRDLHAQPAYVPFVLAKRA